MNHKQKLGYTVLGAVIMLVGLGIGAIVSPPLIAQSDGVFDEIRCSKLTVVDKNGKPAIVLATIEGLNGVTIFDKAGKIAINLVSLNRRGNSITVANRAGGPAIFLGVTEDGNYVFVVNKAGKQAVGLSSDNELGNFVTIYDGAGNIKWTAPE